MLVHLVISFDFRSDPTRTKEADPRYRVAAVFNRLLLFNGKGCLIDAIYAALAIKQQESGIWQNFVAASPAQFTYVNAVPPLDGFELARRIQCPLDRYERRYVTANGLRISDPISV